VPARRVVLDSVILISAFITEHKHGLSAELLRLATAGRLDVYASEAILAETKRVLLEDRRHLRRRYRYSEGEVEQWCEALSELVLMVTDPPAVRVVERDPNDDMVVACALAANADLIVTRDKDLLVLDRYQGIRIVTPEILLAEMRAAQP
jgi:putative PIN family toxin of toxin-antitoxin system